MSTNFTLAGQAAQQGLPVHRGPPTLEALPLAPPLPAAPPTPAATHLPAGVEDGYLLEKQCPACISQLPGLEHLDSGGLNAQPPAVHLRAPAAGAADRGGIAETAGSVAHWPGQGERRPGHKHQAAWNNAVQCGAVLHSCCKGTLPMGRSCTAAKTHHGEVALPKHYRLPSGVTVD